MRVCETKGLEQGEVLLQTTDVNLMASRINATVSQTGASDCECGGGEAHSGGSALLARRGLRILSGSPASAKSGELDVSRCHPITALLLPSVGACRGCRCTTQKAACRVYRKASRVSAAFRSPRFRESQFQALLPY